MSEEKEIGQEVPRAEVVPNGPLRLFSDCDVVLPDGTIIKRERVTGFCRCGASENKPFCDGAHKKIGFVG